MKTVKQWKGVMTMKIGEMIDVVIVEPIESPLPQFQPDQPVAVEEAEETEEIPA